MVPLKLLTRYILRRLSFRLGVDISLYAEIGPGFKIEHFGTIFINSKARIGKRCSVLQGVTVGEYFGAPTIGDFVFIGPGAKLFGNIIIGKNAIIGANSVVTKSIPENAVVTGVPAKVISYRGNLRDNGETMIKAIELYTKLCPADLRQFYGLHEPPQRNI